MKLRRLLEDTAQLSPPRLVLLFGALLAINSGAWVWAWSAFAGRPALLGTALLAWVFGLRHAVDADHIAAIDNVVRKLMQEGKRPLLAGSFFSLGHSAVVVLAVAAIAAGASALQDRLEWLRTIGSTIGTSVSAVFLLLIGLINIVILVGLLRQMRAAKHAAPYDVQLNAVLAGGGLLARMLRPLFRAISRSWHMFPLGFLFGLGFDTATEVGLLALSATQAAQGLPLWHTMVFPTLFTASMVLVDSADSVLMVGTYGWALHQPLRKLWYNLTVTGISVVVALMIGGIEALGLLAGRFNLRGAVWARVTGLGDDLTRVGLFAVLVMLACWAISVAWYRWRRAAAVPRSVIPRSFETDSRRANFVMAGEGRPSTTLLCSTQKGRGCRPTSA